MVKVLRQQLRSKNEEHFSWIEHQMEQCIDNDLQCNICYELFIKVIVFNYYILIKCIILGGPLFFPI